MPLNFQSALAGVVVDLLIADSEVEWSLASGAAIETLQGKSPNEGLRLAFGWKPCGPDLNWLPAWITGAPAPPRIQQQIPEPPGSTALRQPYTKKPDFVTAAHGDRGIDFVQCLPRRRNDDYCLLSGAMSWARMNQLEPIALAYMLIVGSDKYLPRSVRLQGAVPGSLASRAGFEHEALSGRERSGN